MIRRIHDVLHFLPHLKFLINIVPVKWLRAFKVHFAEIFAVCVLTEHTLTNNTFVVIWIPCTDFIIVTLYLFCITISGKIIQHAGLFLRNKGQNLMPALILADKDSRYGKSDIELLFD